jgi:CheY-like chemotaxis protein
VKYGALSTPSGSLSVTWEVTSSGDLSLSWSESGGPPAQPPQHKGFGSTLIERSVPYELGGEAEVNYTPSGLQARFLIPALYVSLREPTPARRSAKQRSHPAAGLEGLRILLVEDNLVITLDAEDALRKAGAAEVRTASTVADAVAIVEKGSLDAAIVDIHLGRETAAKIAEALKQSGIPFALATGYGAGPSLPPGLSGYPLVSKPYTGSTLRDAIRALIPPPPPSN